MNATDSITDVKNALELLGTLSTASTITVSKTVNGTEVLWEISLTSLDPEALFDRFFYAQLTDVDHAINVEVIEISNTLQNLGFNNTETVCNW